MNRNNLFHISELTHAAFTETGRVNLHYTMTLVVHRDGKDSLYFSSPGFRPSLTDKIGEVESVLEFFFRICLLSCFNRKSFRFLTNF